MLSRHHRLARSSTLGDVQIVNPPPSSPMVTAGKVLGVYMGATIAVLGVAYLVSLVIRPAARVVVPPGPRVRPGPVRITEIPAPRRTRSGYRKVDTEILMPVPSRLRRGGRRVRVPVYVQPEPGWNKK